MSSQWFVIDYNRVRAAAAALAALNASVRTADENSTTSHAPSDEALDQVRRNRSGLRLPPGSVVMAEQLPGVVETEDLSATLNRRGWFGSFNVPKNAATRAAFFGLGASEQQSPSSDDSNAAAAAEAARVAHSLSALDSYSFDRAPRARIFARDAPRVHSIGDMQRLLRSNAYRTDPLSRGCPGEAIAARYDLPPLVRAGAGAAENKNECECEVKRPQAFGATDAKITSMAWAAQSAAVAVVGPTRGSSGEKTDDDDENDDRDGDDNAAAGKQDLLPAFSWSRWLQYRSQQEAGAEDTADDTAAAASPLAAMEAEVTAEARLDADSAAELELDADSAAELELDAELMEEVETAKPRAAARSHTAHASRSAAAWRRELVRGMANVLEFEWMRMAPATL